MRLSDAAESEPRLENFQVVENHRIHEVEQTPKLLEGVLNRGPGEEEAVLGVEALELPDEAAVAVLHTLTLVYNQVLPLVLFELAAVDDAHLVRGDDDGHGLLGLDRHVLQPERGPIRLGPVVQQGPRLGQPLLELPDPVGQGGERRRDDEGPLDALLLEVGDEGDDLDGLPQAHLVRQNAREAVLVQSGHPAQTGHLVILELARELKGLVVCGCRLGRPRVRHLRRRVLERLPTRAALALLRLAALGVLFALSSGGRRRRAAVFPVLRAGLGELLEGVVVERGVGPFLGVPDEGAVLRGLGQEAIELAVLAAAE
mmetsp:Transcript_41857/g.94573  ORF Transcript_41857/g.94573 Transcript_41857/m.94573 type:complete len:315 (+) Transcript_41857:639-1583(+)